MCEEGGRRLAYQRGGLPAAALASCACNDRASPANTNGGLDAISPRADASASSSSYLGCCSASRARHDEGLQSAKLAPVAEIRFAPRSADSYSASGDGAEPGEITALVCCGRAACDAGDGRAFAVTKRQSRWRRADASRKKKTAFGSSSSGRLEALASVGAPPRSGARRAAEGGRGSRGAARSRPGSARCRGRAMSGRTRSARGLVLAAPSRAPHANRADRALPRRSESADEDNPQEISPGRGATRGDRGRCEAQHSELARLDACTYLVATARARRAVRRPRRDATEGLSAALDSEMAAMTGKAVEWPGAENDWGDAGVSRERARLEARRDEMRLSLIHI